MDGTLRLQPSGRWSRRHAGVPRPTARTICWRRREDHGFRPVWPSALFVEPRNDGDGLDARQEGSRGMPSADVLATSDDTQEEKVGTTRLGPERSCFMMPPAQRCGRLLCCRPTGACPRRRGRGRDGDMAPKPRMHPISPKFGAQSADEDRILQLRERSEGSNTPLELTAIDHRRLCAACGSQGPRVLEWAWAEPFAEGLQCNVAW